MVKLRVNTATGLPEKPIEINGEIVRPLEYCDICEKFALIRGDTKQHKRHFATLDHQKIEEKMFERIFLAAGKLCLLCKRDVIFINEDELTLSEIRSYRVEPILNFITINFNQPQVNGQFAIYDACRDVLCVNCVRKKRIEALWKLAKLALLPDPDYLEILARMIETLSRCPLCQKYSECVIPSKHHVWDSQEKVKLKTDYKSLLYRRKCRFEMR